MCLTHLTNKRERASSIFYAHSKNLHYRETEGPTDHGIDQQHIICNYDSFKQPTFTAKILNPGPFEATNRGRINATMLSLKQFLIVIGGSQLERRPDNPVYRRTPDNDILYYNIQTGMWKELNTG